MAFSTPIAYQETQSTRGKISPTARDPGRALPRTLVFERTCPFCELRADAKIGLRRLAGPMNERHRGVGSTVRLTEETM